MENKKMTIFYKIRTLDIDGVYPGTQDLRIYTGDMELEDAKLIYNFILLDYNEYVRKHTQEFELIKTDNGEIILQMKDKYKELMKQFL